VELAARPIAAARLEAVSAAGTRHPDRSAGGAQRLPAAPRSRAARCANRVACSDWAERRTAERSRDAGRPEPGDMPGAPTVAAAAAALDRKAGRPARAGTPLRHRWAMAPGRTAVSRWGSTSAGRTDPCPRYACVPPGRDRRAAECPHRPDARIRRPVPTRPDRLAMHRVEPAADRSRADPTAVRSAETALPSAEMEGPEAAPAGPKAGTTRPDAAAAEPTANPARPEPDHPPVPAPRHHSDLQAQREAARREAAQPRAKQPSAKERQAARTEARCSARPEPADHPPQEPAYAAQAYAAPTPAAGKAAAPRPARWAGTRLGRHRAGALAGRAAHRAVRAGRRVPERRAPPAARTVPRLGRAAWDLCPGRRRGRRSRPPRMLPPGSPFVPEC
jgi:hypothetical protein